MTTTRILSVWIGNLADYNAGLLNGHWFDLDDYDAETLQEAVDELTNGGDDEFFIADYETPFDITVNEYTSINGLYERYEVYENIIDEYGDDATDIINAYSNMISDSITNIGSYDFYIYSNCYNMADVAYEIMEQSGELDEMPEHLRRYFDFESYGRDIEIERTFYYAGGGVYVEIVS